MDISDHNNYLDQNWFEWWQRGRGVQIILWQKYRTFRGGKRAMPDCNIVLMIRHHKTANMSPRRHTDTPGTTSWEPRGSCTSCDGAGSWRGWRWAGRWIRWMRSPECQGLRGEEQTGRDKWQQNTTAGMDLHTNRVKITFSTWKKTLFFNLKRTNSCFYKLSTYLSQPKKQSHCCLCSFSWNSCVKDKNALMFRNQITAQTIDCKTQ